MTESQKRRKQGVGGGWCDKQAAIMVKHYLHVHTDENQVAVVNGF